MEKKIKKAKIIGGSVMISLTGFIKPGCFYKIESEAPGKSVTLTMIEV